jgi:hypothetical protein
MAEAEYAPLVARAAQCSIGEREYQKRVTKRDGRNFKSGMLNFLIAGRFSDFGNLDFKLAHYRISRPLADFALRL